MREVKMRWRDVDYTIPATKAFEIGERVEDIATLAEVASWGHRPKMFKLAKCYGEMLRFAGCKVADTVVLEAITPVEGKEQDAASDAIKALVDLLLTGAKTTEGEAEPPKKTSDL
jgi:hypothetical protein